MLASVVIPIMAIVTRTPLMRISLLGFYIHFGPPTLVLLAAVIWLRNLKWLRPSAAKAISWETALFQLARWPWALLGCVHAVAGRIAGREFSFKITPKGRSGPAPLPTRVVPPYLLLALARPRPASCNSTPGRPRLLHPRAHQRGALHDSGVRDRGPAHRRSPRALRRQVRRASVGKIAAITATAIVAIGGSAARASCRRGTRHGPGAVPEAIAGGGASALKIGVSTDALAKNSTDPWTPRDLAQVSAFEDAAQTHAGIVMWFSDWQHTRPEPAQLRAIAAAAASRRSLGSRGTTPSVCATLSPLHTGVDHRRRARRLRAQWARALRAYGGPVLLRFGQEMNGVGIRGQRAPTETAPASLSPPGVTSTTSSPPSTPPT